MAVDGEPVEPMLLPMRSLKEVRESWWATLRDAFLALCGIVPLIGLVPLCRVAASYFIGWKVYLLPFLVIIFEFGIWAGWEKQHQANPSPAFVHAEFQSANLFICLSTLTFGHILVKNTMSILDDIGDHRRQDVWRLDAYPERLLQSLREKFNSYFDSLPNYIDSADPARNRDVSKKRLAELGSVQKDVSRTVLALIVASIHIDTCK